MGLKVEKHDLLECHQGAVRGPQKTGSKIRKTCKKNQIFLITICLELCNVKTSIIVKFSCF